MRIRVRTLKRALFATGLAVVLVAVAVPVLADYTGPDRVISTFSWQRKVCEYEAVYDPPGAGWFGCTLTLYEDPEGRCDTSVSGYFTPRACGWPQNFCEGPGCDISRSESIDGCSPGQPGCRQVEEQTTLPEATISGTIACSSPGSGGWCRGGGALDLSGSEPVAGESILALEGTHNGATFACSGADCSVDFVEGNNDFTFWAHSSFGDTSQMGFAGGMQDSVDPSLSGSASGTPGDSGWYVSDVTIEADASDGTSGLASLDVRIDGGGWASYGGPVSVGDGSHTVELRAVDAAGNTSSDSLSFEVDTVSPIADFDATPSFCPGCGETADITIVAQDSGSGVAAWRLTAGGATIASGSGAIGETISWDGSGLAGGLHTLDLEVRDMAGNEAGASFEVRLIEPTPTPTDVPTATRVPSATPEAPSLLSLFSVPTATAVPTAGGAAIPTSSGGPSATRTPRVVLFGGPPLAPAGPSSSDPISNPQSPISSTPSSPALYGAAALALVAGVTAVAAENMRRRREAEARQRAEMARVNAEAEAQERARAAAIAAAKAEHDLMMGQIMLQATGGESPSAEWLAAAALAAETARRMTRKEERLEPKIPPRLDLARLKQADYVAGEAWEAGREEREAAQAYATYRAGERVSVPFTRPVETAPAEKAWWERALDWVDQHQAVVSIAVGAVVAGAIIVLTAGTATPLVVAGLAALGAAGSVTIGTASLNAHYDRAWHDNLARNTAFAVGGSAVVLGGWWLATGGLAAIGGSVGTTVATACLRFPTACARMEPVLQAVDTAEQLLLSAQLGVQTAMRDPRASQTALELQLEMMDGGVPGNTTIRHLRDAGDAAAQALARYGDEAAAIAEVVAERSDDVLRAFDNGVVHVRPEGAKDFAEDLFSNLRALDRGGVGVYYSATSGAVYTSAPTVRALEALDELEVLVRSGKTSGGEVNRLVDVIASESSRGTGERVVLGRFGTDGVYIHESLDHGGVFYDTGDVVWERLKALRDRGFDPTAINLAFMRYQMEQAVASFQLADETIEEVFRDRADSVTAIELSFLEEHAPGYGYVLEDGIWVFRGR